MALRGTLDTFALPDVLRLLGATNKTGRLRITGDRGTGSVWSTTGQISSVEATHAPHANRPVDALFELLRFQDGAFTFDAGATHDAPGDAIDVEQLLAQAESLLDEWHEIEAVVPSMDLWVTLSSTLPEPEVTLDAARWATIVAVGAGATVRRIGDELCLGELPISRAIMHLVEAGLVEIAEVAPVGSPWPSADAPAEVARPLVAPRFAASALDDEPFEMEATDEPAVVPQAPAPAPAPASGPRARRVKAAASPESDTGLFVPLDLPGHAQPASYDAEPEPEPAPAPKAPARSAAKSARSAPKAKQDSDATDGPVELEDLAAAFPGLAREEATGDVVDDDDEIARQLARLSPRAASAIRAVAAATGADDGTDETAGDGDQPISRGLLLKFLSSVKS